MDNIKVGKTISFLRKQYGLTQRQLAERIGVSDKAVSKWERGVGSPDISLLSKLAIALDIDIESLLEGNLDHLGMQWRGILILNYPSGLGADTQLYDKPLVYLQLSYFLLMGIRHISVWGSREDMDFIKWKIGNGENLGISATYHEQNNIHYNNVTILGSDEVSQMINRYGGVIIDNVDFIYGKDLTKTFRRIIYDSKGTIRLENSTGEPLSMLFCHPGRLKKDKHQLQRLERGVTAFPIKTYSDLQDSAELIRVIQGHMHEKVADLDQIAEVRGLINTDK
ncbi:MAG: XRE family transcriptional regulator [Lachnospiraceae bacterium]|nr:XRE family transcriptional regulator [Lachnospiraceae bacterium]